MAIPKERGLRSVRIFERSLILSLPLCLVLAVLVGADNLPIASAFVADFDQVHVSCAAPCADGVGQ